MKKYNVWKCKPNGDPIEGTDKVYEGKSKRWVMNQVAYENGIEVIQNKTIVRLANGEFFICVQI